MPHVTGIRTCPEQWLEVTTGRARSTMQNTVLQFSKLLELIHADVIVLRALVAQDVVLVLGVAELDDAAVRESPFVLLAVVLRDPG